MRSLPDINRRNANAAANAKKFRREANESRIARFTAANADICNHTGQYDGAFANNHGSNTVAVNSLLDTQHSPEASDVHNLSS